MIHLRCRQLSEKVGLVAAVSTLAFTNGPRDWGRLNPHTIGNAERSPFLLGAITGTRFVGRISPSVYSERLSWLVSLSVSADWLTASQIGRNSDEGLRKYRQHIESPSMGDEKHEIGLAPARTVQYNDTKTDRSKPTKEEFK